MTSQAYQAGEAARSAQRRDDRARTRTIPAAKRSTAATFRNIQCPYHWKRQNRQPRYVLKYLHLGLNSRQQLALNGEGRLLLRNPEAMGSPAGATSRHQLARESRHQLARPIGTARLLSMRC
jgi:hypothetical protein